ncbi:tetratricopeptide repeat protein [Chloroflexota bacterium]
MSYQEERQVRLKRQLSKQAIALAMQGRWREAVAANKTIIDSFSNDIEAYNRLGRAYIELGEYPQAREAYGRTMELDPYNSIARKNLRRLSHLGETAVSVEGDSYKTEPQHFIEEIGKAGVINVYHLAPKEILARVVAGDRVFLKIDGPILVVENSRGEYLGQVEPKHGQRLIKLMGGGNRYTAAIVRSIEGSVTVIIREIYRDPSQAEQLSFPSKGDEGLRSYVNNRIFGSEMEYKGEGEREPGYTIIGRDEAELLPE